MMHLLHLLCFPSLCSSQYSHAFISQEEDSSLVQADDLRADVQAAGVSWWWCVVCGVCGVWCVDDGKRWYSMRTVSDSEAS